MITAVSVPEAEAAGEETAAVAPHGTELFTALNKLKKIAAQRAEDPHAEAEIEAYAASIAAKGILQNLGSNAYLRRMASHRLLFRHPPRKPQAGTASARKAQGVMKIEPSRCRSTREPICLR